MIKIALIFAMLAVLAGCVTAENPVARSSVKATGSKAAEAVRAQNSRGASQVIVGTAY